jgi:Transglutaminase-like superfamily
MRGIKCRPLGQNSQKSTARARARAASRMNFTPSSRPTDPKLSNQFADSCGDESGVQRWLRATPLLDLDNPKLRVTAHKLTQRSSSVAEQAVAIHAHVKSLPFGCIAHFDHVSASEVLAQARGDCHTKGTLFVALCRIAGIPARLRFVGLPAAFLHGVIDAGKSQIAHAVAEVHIAGQWLQTDAYVVDEALALGARKRLLTQGLRCGYGIHIDGQDKWSASGHSHEQYCPADPQSMPTADWGVAHDPQHFYATTKVPELERDWMSRAKWMVAATIINRHVDTIRKGV